MKFTETELKNIEKNCAVLIYDELNDNFYKKKRDSLLLSDSYRRLNMLDYATRVRNCGGFLQYRVDPNRLDEQNCQRLYKAYFCGNILCSICAWRRARKISNQLIPVMSRLKDYRFIFLTLTIQSVYTEELYPAVDDMLSRAWHRLVNIRRFKAAILGYYRSFELTHDTEPVITKTMYRKKNKYYDRNVLKVGDKNPTYNTWHPHLHVICAVSPEYFDKNNSLYIKQEEWRELWQQALDVRYEPYVFIEVIYNKNSNKKGSKSKKTNMFAILEAAKYTAKSNDYLVRGKNRRIDEIRTDEAVYALSSSLKGRRLISYGGVFKEAHKSLHLDEIEDGSLLHIGKNIELPMHNHILYNCVWSKSGYSVEAIYK